MKNIAILILFIVGLWLQSCNFKETFVHPFSITDSWRLTEHQRYPDSSWNAINSLIGRFKLDENIQYDKEESHCSGHSVSPFLNLRKVTKFLHWLVTQTPPVILLYRQNDASRP